MLVASLGHNVYRSSSCSYFHLSLSPALLVSRCLFLSDVSRALSLSPSHFSVLPYGIFWLSRDRIHSSHFSNPLSISCFLPPLLRPNTLREIRVEGASNLWYPTNNLTAIFPCRTAHAFLFRSLARRV